MTTPVRRPCTRGPLISVEGITGVGKTYLTSRAVETLNDKPLMLEGFSRRAPERPELGEALSARCARPAERTRSCAGAPRWPRPCSLLAIKRHDLDTVIPELSGGRTVVEGRSIDTTAVCQALLLHPGAPDAALDEAVALLDLAASFRPLPDLTILVTDDASAAVERAQRRDNRIYTPEQATFMHEACALYERLAATDPARYRVVDRRSAASTRRPGRSARGSMTPEAGPDLHPRAVAGPGSTLHVLRPPRGPGAGMNEAARPLACPDRTPAGDLHAAEDRT